MGACCISKRTVVSEAERLIGEFASSQNQALSAGIAIGVANLCGALVHQCGGAADEEMGRLLVKFFDGLPTG